MKSLSKKIVAIALGGFLLMGIGSTVTEASPAHGHNAPQVEYYDHGEPPPPPPQREKEHHKKNNNGAIIAGAIIGAVIANNL